MKKYEMYLSLEEYYTIENEAILQLKNFTKIKCQGVWKRKNMDTIVLIYIAVDEEHENRFLNFYDYVKNTLPVAHYVCYNIEMKLDRKEVKQFA